MVSKTDSADFERVSINCGIFLNRLHYWCRFDDLKCIAKDEDKVSIQLQIIEQFL